MRDREGAGRQGGSERVRGSERVVGWFYVLLWLDNKQGVYVCIFGFCM